MKKKIEELIQQNEAVIGSSRSPMDRAKAEGALSGFSVEDLQAEIDRRKESEWPKVGEEAWFLSDRLGVFSLFFATDEYAKSLLEVGNLFRTEEEAEAAAKRARLALKGPIMTADEAIDFATYVSDNHRDEVTKKFAEYTEGDQ